MQLKKLKRIAKNLNRNHELAILISFLLGLGLVSAVFILAANLGMLTSFAAVLALFFIASRAWSGIIAGASYMGRAIDFISAEKTLLDAIQSLFFKHKQIKLKPKINSQQLNTQQLNSQQLNTIGRREQIGYLLGLLTCTAMCLWLILSSFSVPLLMPLGPIVAYSIFFVVSAGIFAGLFSRVGRLLDCFYKAKNWREVVQIFNHNYELALIITLLAGISISLSGLATIGASAIFPGINPFLAGAFFTISVTGALVSGASYIGRALDYLCNEQTILRFAVTSQNKLLAAPGPYLRPGQYENMANIIGIMIALGLCTALLLTGFEIPFLAALHSLAYPVLYVTCVGIFAGMFSRIGRTLDRALPVTLTSEHRIEKINNPYATLLTDQQKPDEAVYNHTSILSEKSHPWQSEPKPPSTQPAITGNAEISTPTLRNF